MGGSPVREQCLINLEQGLLVIDKEIQEVVLVLLCEIDDPNSVLSQLSQPKKRLFEVPGLLYCLVNVVELFTRVNLVFQPAAHDLLPDFFDALHKKRL